MKGDESWNYAIDGKESLEFLITLLKSMRNSLAHNYSPITETQLEERLIGLNQLLTNMMRVLEERAGQIGVPFLTEEKEAIIAEVVENITDAMTYANGA